MNAAVIDRAARPESAAASAARNGGPAAAWTPVCRLDDIVPNTGVCCLVGGEQVAVFRLDDDRLFALGNHDPCSGANVLSRGLVGDLKGELVVASPIYKQHFSLATGRCLEEADAAVPVFAVRLDGDTVCVGERVTIDEHSTIDERGTIDEHATTDRGTA